MARDLTGLKRRVFANLGEAKARSLKHDTRQISHGGESWEERGRNESALQKLKKKVWRRNSRKYQYGRQKVSNLLEKKERCKAGKREGGSCINGGKEERPGRTVALGAGSVEEYKVNRCRKRGISIHKIGGGGFSDTRDSHEGRQLQSEGSKKSVSRMKKGRRPANQQARIEKGFFRSQ